MSNSSLVSFLSFQHTKESNGELEVVSIRISEIKASFDTFVMVEILDLSDV
jgi:hypothetical protein